MQSMAEIRLAQPTDLPEYRNFLLRHGRESGTEGNLIFTSHEEPWNRALEESEKERPEKWAKPGALPQ